MHLFLTLIYAGLFLWMIYRWQFFNLPGVDRVYLAGIFALKILAGIGVWSLYTYYYEDRETSDVFRYFDDAMMVYGFLPEEPMNFFRLLLGIDLDNPSLQPFYDNCRAWHSGYTYGVVNDNPTVIRINAVVALFSFGYYHVHTVFMSFIGLIGSVGLFRFFQGFQPTRSLWILLACTIIPTVLFWSSSVLKEPILLLFLGLMMYYFIRMLNQCFSYFIPFFIFFGLMFFVKPYVVPAAIPALLFLFWRKLSPRFSALLQWSIIHAGSLIIALNASEFFKAGNLVYILSKKREDFYNVADMENAGSVINIPEYSSALEWILNWPVFIVTTYFRPHPFEWDSMLYTLASVENLILCIVLLSAIIGFRAYQLVSPNFLGVCLSFTLIMGILIGSSVPVMGAIVRYKLPALPFLFVLCLPGLQYTLNKYFRREKGASLQD